MTWGVEAAEKGGYPHFFLKEISEQPSALANALRGRVDEDSVHLAELDAIDWRHVERVHLLACGTAYHAAMLGKLAFEQWARLPAEAVVASEFRYASPVITDKSLAILVSQSGETADTLACFRQAREAHAQTIALTNVVGSSITRGADAAVYLRVGPEICVVASKTFVAQVALLYAMALDTARRLGRIDGDEIARLTHGLVRLPDLIQGALGANNQVQHIAEMLSAKRSCFFFGRGFTYPAALEGALKLKEVSYLHAEGYAAGELKHGPIAMLDPEIPVVAIATAAPTHEKVISNIQEVRARRAPIVAIASEGDSQTAEHADHIIYVARAIEPLNAILAVVPLQLLAYHVAIARGCDIDQPRNLAKSVTVE